MDWLLLQLADSAFPTGGFAHSGGLEALMQFGEIRSADEFEQILEATLWQSGFASFPLITAAHREGERLAELDQLCDAFLSAPIVNRASRTQGRAFLSTCVHTFDNAELVDLQKRVFQREIAAHYAPLFGFVHGALDVSLADTQKLFLHITLRGVLSAAIRLGIIGPQRAQQMQHTLAPLLTLIESQCCNLGISDLSQPAPLLDLFASMHDKLYSRLFQS